MTLATHAVVGAAIAEMFPTHPVLGGCLAFFSHFLLDAIPHWDYKLRSSVEDSARPMNNDINANGPEFILDLLKIGSDFSLGLLLSIALFYPQSMVFWAPTLIGAICGMLPDPLQFVYMKMKREPLITLQRFHMWMHARLHLKGKPVIGILTQAVLVVIVVSVVRMLIKI